MSFRLATVNDFIDVTPSRFRCSSYKNSAYPLGCSMSELDSALGEGDFAVFNDTINVGFIRIKAMFHGIAYLDFHLLSGMADKEVQSVLSWLSEHYDIGKYYLQLLPHEQLELDCLTRLGFTEEARLRDQLFVEGTYCDLIMMGSEDKRV